MRPGIPWVDGIDQAAWRRAWRRAGDVPPSRWPDPRGLRSLREALCGYLRRTRGLGCTPDHILITRGVAGGLSLLAAALLRPGERAGLEEPGYPVGRAILAARGARVVPCPVDSDGLVVDRLPGDLRLVYTTPAHQYPLGGRLPVPRRQALAGWARAAGALVVEDDYDSEFRYDVAPLPALYGLDPDVVAYLGTTAKLLTPALGVGWLVARPDLITRLAGTRENLGDRTGEAAQLALLAMIESGDLDRHVRRMRREYARRRDAIVSALGDPAVPADAPRRHGGPARGAGTARRPRGRRDGGHPRARCGGTYAAALLRRPADRAGPGTRLRRAVPRPGGGGRRGTARRPDRTSRVLIASGVSPRWPGRRPASSACAPLLRSVAGSGSGTSAAGRAGTPVNRSTSMAPGPAARQHGTWEAPKWPPRAHSLRLRTVVCA